MNHGSSARSVTSVTARVKELSHTPSPATRSGSWATRRWAAFFAFSALSPASAMMSLSLAPPRDLMPPAALMSSIAISAPFFTRSPWRAQGPESGAISATFTSAEERAVVVQTAKLLSKHKCPRELHLVDDDRDARVIEGQRFVVSRRPVGTSRVLLEFI